MMNAQPFDDPILQCITSRCARQFRMRSGEMARSDRHAIGKSIALMNQHFSKDMLAMQQPEFAGGTERGEEDYRSGVPASSR
jgi:hypothetical protein